MAKAKIKDTSELAPSGKPWSYGIRTWGTDGASHGGFIWDLTPGARTTAPDWKPVDDCGNGLHCNAWGVEDWSLLGDLSEVASGKRVLGIVRFDPEGALDLDGKHKAEWMEIVLTTKTADLASVLNWLSPKRHAHIHGLTKVQEKAAATTGYGSAAATTGYRSAAATTGNGSAAATTGDYSAAATTGDYSAAATTGYRSAAATTGYRSAAATTGNGSAAATTGNGSAAATTGNGSAAATTGYGSAAATTGYRSAAATTGYRSAAATTGKHSIAAALGPNSPAKAGPDGAIVLTAWEQRLDHSWAPKRGLFAFVGETHGEVTIKPDTFYRLTVDGVVEETEA